jgi:hypothetical protein
MNSLRSLGLISAALLFASCGPAPSTARESLEIPNTGSFLLLTSGASPSNLLIKAGGTISIVNEDTVAHMFASNPYPQRSDCPEINTPTLRPGATHTVTLRPMAERCGFHDFLQPGNVNFQGMITVQN